MFVAQINLNPVNFAQDLRGFIMDVSLKVLEVLPAVGLVHYQVLFEVDDLHVDLGKADLQVNPYTDDHSEEGERLTLVAEIKHGFAFTGFMGASQYERQPLTVYQQPDSFFWFV